MNVTGLATNLSRADATWIYEQHMVKAIFRLVSDFLVALATRSQFCFGSLESLGKLMKSDRDRNAVA